MISFPTGKRLSMPSVVRLSVTTSFINSWASFHSFPLKDPLRARRIQAIPKDESKRFAIWENTVVCSDHFVESDFILTSKVVVLATLLLLVSLRAMFCLEFISVCMYVCMRASCMFILHASSACILHAVHSHSCICLLRGVAYSLGVIAYIWL